MPKAKGYTLLAPEVLQISSMDCGVAALACFAQAYGCGVSYERLREACQTGVDGTSIDSLEDVSTALGIDVIQHIIPVDMFYGAMEGRYPFIAIVRHEAGIPHFVVVWRRVGAMLQVMDPGRGRTWVLAERFLESLYIHAHRMPQDAFLEWWETSTFAETLEETGSRLLKGPAKDLVRSLRDGRAVAEISAADTALRVSRFAEKKGLASGRREELFMGAFERCVQAFHRTGPAAAMRMRSIAAVEESDELVSVAGAIVLAPPERDQPRALVRPEPMDDGDDRTQTHAMSDVAAASLESTEREPSIFTTVWGLLDAKHRSLAIALLLANIIFIPVVVFETLLYRAGVDAVRLFESPTSRVQLAAMVLSFFVMVLSLEWLTDWGGRRLGAFVEIKLRLQVLRAMPRVDEQFVRSRPTTDLANRAQMLTMGRGLPSIIFGIVRSVIELCAALGALALIEPLAVPVVLVGALALLGVSNASVAALREVGTRFQAHASRMLLLFLDALRGVRPVRTHGFHRSFRREYERELQGWKKTSENDFQVNGIFSAIDGLVGLLITAACLAINIVRHPDIRGFVLLAFWALRIPGLVTGVVGLVRSYPMAHLSLTRILEVTKYAKDTSDGAQIPRTDRGVNLTFRNVRVLAAGRTLLEKFSLDIPSGQHVAIVGPSGAGKSSLLSVLLGLLRPASGRVLANDVLLDETSLPSLRAMTAWVDPSTQLWNSTLLANLEYATTGETRRSLEDVLVAANLFPIVDNLREGLNTKIGWDGTSMSGGEGQRVRIGRALMRSETKLAVLDEPFRGLDQMTRRRMLNECRKLWLNATLVFVSHDIAHALDFDRVLVVENGTLVEDGHPLALRQDESSRFRALLDAETKAKREVWDSNEWRHLRMVNGVLEERTS